MTLYSAGKNVFLEIIRIEVMIDFICSLEILENNYRIVVLSLKNFTLDGSQLKLRIQIFAKFSLFLFRNK